jgi:hypothetical protein
MAILSRVNYLSQQRLDLQHVIATDSFNAFDLRAFSYILNGLEKNYVVRGLEISALNGFTVTVKVANSIILFPLDNEASFYYGLADASDEIINVPPSTEKVFLEAFLERVTETPVTAAFFDPSNTNDQNPAGQEFNASVDFQSIVKLQLRYNTEGFSVDAIPLAILRTGSAGVIDISDARDLFFRLGSGGALPSPYKKYAWSSNRVENALPAQSIYLNQFTPQNPYYTQDANGIINDKALTNLKDWMDATMTIIAEMKGSASWYTPIAGKTIPNLLFLNPNATSFVPSVDGRTLLWSGTQLKSSSLSGSSNPLSLAMNYGPVKWEIGGTFINAFTNRAFTNTDFTASIPDNAAFFLKLDREKIPVDSSGNSVKWGVETLLIPTPPLQEYTVSGQEGDFTGVAIGDYIRKLGEDYYQYNRVVGLVEGGIVYSTTGRVSTAITTALIVEYPIDTPTTEPFRWFRSRYQLSDLFVTSDAQGLKVQSVDVSPLILPVDDINLYFLGRRKGDLFQLRNYGVMQPGEEVPLMEDADSSPVRSIPNLFLKLDYGIEMSGAGALSSLNSNVLTIQKRRTSNLVEVGLNNADAWQTFNISSATLSFANDGDGLWVRLNDTTTSTPATLTSGVVDFYQSGAADNTYEIIPASRNPRRDLRNKNVMLIARRTTVNGVVSLQFFDGSVVQIEGLALQRDLTKIITGVTTSTSATVAVNHGFLRATTDFMWNARITSTGQNVWIGGTQSSAGVTLDSTPDAAQSLTIMFTRHLR